MDQPTSIHPQASVSPETQIPTTTKVTTSRFVPPQLLAILAMFSVQLGAAFAEKLFSSIGSEGATFLRLVFGASILLLFWRPRLRGHSRADYLIVVLFGVSVAIMNGLFYASIARLPLGIAVTVEFVGPLGVALFASRRWTDLVWTLFAVVGVLLLAPIQGSKLDPLGLLFALLAGAGWAAYILLNVRLGKKFQGGVGLSLSLGIAALVFAPFGITSLGAVWQHPYLLLLGLLVAILSTVIPFSLELETLRRLPANVFGILMSLEPVVAALTGVIVLHEAVSLHDMLAMALIVVASAGVSFTDRKKLSA
ncbi:EamA family transporter [Tengunoibacter tsumagoiensis]|uniref:Threonine transporter RhtB n=1 Tax=Tengunoibacter tsumagoiensis TaxID=2014871 RepID=A0A401ZV98_9CHLR|nr:EamA family transporter [Tengunoibacter tsumagoiensis]GCE10813.1 threonine transporter RhtB [Tengunoibacter tsumagoiensis]